MSTTVGSTGGVTFDAVGSGASFTFSDAITASSTINNVTITTPATSATLTIANTGSLITSGAFALTLTATATTNVTLPTSGTLYGTASGSITSAQLLASLSDETGTGSLVFSTAPTFSGILTVNNGSVISVGTSGALLSLRYDASNRSDFFVNSSGGLSIVGSGSDKSVAITGTFSVSSHVTLEGVTSTGATGTGKLVFDTAPTFSTTIAVNGASTLGGDCTFGGNLLSSSTLSIKTNAMANGQAMNFDSLTEVTTVAAAATSDTTFSLPANAVIFSVSVRVTTAIPTAATFTVTGATSGTTFNTAAVAVAANTTDVGTKAGAFFNSASQKVRITPNLTPLANTGRVRVTAHYYTITAPTS